MFELETFKKLSLPTRSECLYTSCYCEENVWKLCEQVKDTQPNLLPYCYVVFISNRNQTVPLWKQSVAQNEDGLTVWDYHVIFIHKPCDNSEALVYDLDSLLPFPTSFNTYFIETFRSDDVLKLEYHRYFRIILAESFLKTFSSDRSRMIAEDGSWLKPPPPYPCIKAPEYDNNLNEFISMDPKRGFGEVLSIKQFEERFNSY